MDLETLKTFVTLANLGNFTQTAQQLSVVQSTVSSRIKELENEVGASLFTRERKHLRLTAAGEFFLSYANEMICLENYALSGINTLGTYSDSLKLGSVQTLYGCHLSSALIAYRKQYPDISVKITLDHSRNLLNLIYDDLLDICFTYRKFLHADYVCLPYRSDRILLVTGTKGEAVPNSLSIAELCRLPLFYSNFIDTTESGWFHQLFPKHYTYPLEIDVGNCLIPFLEEGLGYSFLPESAVSEQLKRGTLVSVSVPELAIPPLNSYMIMKKSASSKESIRCWLKEYR